MSKPCSDSSCTYKKPQIKTILDLRKSSHGSSATLNIHINTNKAYKYFKKHRRQKRLHFLTFKFNGSAHTVTVFPLSSQGSNINILSLIKLVSFSMFLLLNDWNLKLIHDTCFRIRRHKFLLRGRMSFILKIHLTQLLAFLSLNQQCCVMASTHLLRANAMHYSDIYLFLKRSPKLIICLNSFYTSFQGISWRRLTIKISSAGKTKKLSFP